MRAQPLWVVLLLLILHHPLGLAEILRQARQCLLQAEMANIYTNIVKTEDKSGIIQDDETQR